MTTPKFTPGPWALDGDNIHCSIIGPDGEFVVAGECDGWMVPFECRDEGMANARLIAAAPEMYEALCMVAADNTAGCLEVIDLVMAALAKANPDA